MNVLSQLTICALAATVFLLTTSRNSKVAMSFVVCLSLALVLYDVA